MIAQIAVLEEQKKAYIKNAEDEGNKIQTDHYLKLNIDEVPKKETQVMLLNLT